MTDRQMFTGADARRLLDSFDRKHAWAVWQHLGEPRSAKDLVNHTDTPHAHAYRIVEDFLQLELIRAVGERPRESYGPRNHGGPRSTLYRRRWDDIQITADGDSLTVVCTPPADGLPADVEDALEKF